MSTTLKGVGSASSRKRPSDDNDDYREKQPKVRKMGPENDKHQAGRARTRRNASITDKDIDTLTNSNSMLKKTLVFSHVEVPRASWWPATEAAATATAPPVEDHSKRSSTLPEYYGPSIGPLPLFLARCDAQSRAAIDGLCQVLSFFGIFVYRGMLICTLHPRGLDIIPLSLLPVHLDRRHKNSLQRGTDSDRTLIKKNVEIYSEIAHHVSKCCGISLLQSLEDVIGTEEVSDLLRPHPDISSKTQKKMAEPVEEVHAEQRFLCPVTTCQEWVAFDKNKGSGRAELIRHITESHQLDSKAKKTARFGVVTTRWIQKVAVVSRQGGNRFKFLLLPVGWETTKTSQPVVPTEPGCSAAKFFDATWTAKTRWNQSRAAFKGVSPKILSELVAAPAMALIPQKLGTKPRAIELGLYNLKRVVYMYLLEFREILATIPGVRDIIAMKLVSRYKVSSKLSYYKPCAILVSTIALMMRYRLYRALSGKSEYLGNFELACTLEQERTSKELYDLLISSNGEPSIAELQKKFHALCVALITSCCSMDSCLACPTDQVLFIHGLESNLEWKSPVGVYSRCGHLQIAFQAIFIQMARLSATPSRDYQPYDSELFDFGDDIDLSDAFDDDVLEDEDETENPQETIQSQSPTSSVLQVILSFSRDHISLLDPHTSEGVMSPFSRLKTLSSILFASVKTANPEDITVTNVGRSIQVSFPNGYSSSLDLNTWSHGAILALSEYQRAVAALCPSSFCPETFTCHRLRDDFGCAALFKQEHNAKWLDPLRDSIWKELLRNQNFVCAGKVQVKACQQWLEKEQVVLRTLAVVFALTCGVCPPQHGFRVRFDTQYPEIRDLWLIDPGQVIWVQNRSRLQNIHFTPAVFCLPTVATSLVMLYLCIFRPISCQVLSLLSRDATLHSHEIWSHFRYRLDKPYYWNGPDITQPILKHTVDTMDRAYSPAVIRLLVRPILQRYFSNSILYHMASIIDPAAQHTNKTSLSHYGRISTLPYIPHLEFYHTEQSIAFSRVWHSLLGLGPIEEGLVIGDDIRILFSHLGFIGGGLLHSRHAVKVYGDLSDKGLVEELVQKQPFASGSSVHFGDSVLLDITCCITQDISNEALLDNACFTEHVVTAICLILRALNERATGQFMDLEHLDVESLVHYSHFRNHFAEVVKTFKETYMDGWKAFIRVVIGVRSL